MQFIQSRVMRSLQRRMPNFTQSVARVVKSMADSNPAAVTDVDLIRRDIRKVETAALELSGEPATEAKRQLDRAVALLKRLEATYDYDMGSARTWPAYRQYNNWARECFGQNMAYPPYPCSSSWAFDSKWGQQHLTYILELFSDFERSLMEEVHTSNVPGAVAEFGIFQGHMLGVLLDHADKIGMRRDFYGFDSFEGLSEPSPENDYPGWAKGQYAAGYDEVAAFLRLKDRPHLKLVRGFFDQSLKGPEAQSVREIAYARIDCDIYPPTVDCLDYLSTRLTDGAILAFDDWVYDIHKGETKAFYEWSRRVPHLRFEFLGFASWRFYMRVRHR